MEKEIDNKVCPECGKPFEEHNNAGLAEIIATEITIKEFPNIWTQKKQELKQMSKRELAEEMYFAGAFDMFGSFNELIEELKEEKIES